MLLGPPRLGVPRAWRSRTADRCREVCGGQAGLGAGISGRAWRTDDPGREAVEGADGADARGRGAAARGLTEEGNGEKTRLPTIHTVDLTTSRRYCNAHLNLMTGRAPGWPHTVDVAQDTRQERPRKTTRCLPFRGAPGAKEVLLLTSRGTGRWVFPKGWAEKGLKGHELAAKEAFEEAGIVGKVGKQAIGAYSYDKDGLELFVRVFPLEVQTLLDDWPEKAERNRKWFSLAEAATLLDEGELVILMLRLSTENIEAGDPTT